MDSNQSTPAPFLSKMLWNTGTPKQELNLGMMPPPTTLVPVAQRRPSALMDNHHSPPMRSMKTEMVDENSQGSVMDHMMSDNSMDSMRHRFRPVSESSLDVHQEESNIAMMNENSIEMLRRQEIINENSNISVVTENSMDVRNGFHCEKSNHSTQNEDSVESIHSPVVAERMMSVLTSPVLGPAMPPPEIVPPPTLTTNDLKGIDLRMKGPITPISDLADTQPPSMATLLKFGVTEPTNMPLPAQSGQSIENFFLTTLESTVNKPVLSDTVANNTMKSELIAKTNELLDSKVEMNSIITQQVALSQLLTEQSVPGTKLFTEQVITSPQELSGTLLANASVEILPTLSESHIKSTANFDTIVNNGQMIFNPPTGTALLTKTAQTEVLKNEADLIMTQQTLLNTNLLPPTTVAQTEALKTEANLILSQQSLQAALSTNLLPATTATPKLDALVNSTVESHIGSPIRSPQQELITNSPQEIMRRSPLLQPPEIILSPTHPPEVLLNPQTPLLSSTLSPVNELLIRSPQNEITHQDVILNTQVSPSVICTQEALLGSSLTTICQPNALETCLQTNQLQPELIPETELHGSNNTALIPNHLNLGIKVTMPSDCMVMNAVPEMPVAHLMEQKAAQNQIMNIFDHSATSTPQGAHAILMKNLIISQLPQQPFVETNPQNVLSSVIEEKASSEFLNQQESVKPELVKQLPEQPTRPCPEMIPQALTNMSENDLISYINPSCFDPEGTYAS